MNAATTFQNGDDHVVRPRLSERFFFDFSASALKVSVRLEQGIVLMDSKIQDCRIFLQEVRSEFSSPSAECAKNARGLATA